MIDFISITISKLEGDELVVHTYRGPGPAEKLLGWRVPVANSPVYSHTINYRQPVVIPDVQGNTPMAAAFRRMLGQQLAIILDYLGSWMAVPLLLRETVIGTMSIGHSRANHYSLKDAEQLLSFTQYMALSIEKDVGYEQARTVATLQERDRLARELHDNLAQALGFVNLKLAVTSDLLEQGEVEQAKEPLHQARQMVNETYTDVREEIFNLRTMTSADSTLVETLREYLTRYKESYQLNITLIINNDHLEGVSQEISTQIIRIIQEALINIRKHADVDQATIHFERVGSELLITISDEGRGFDIEQNPEANKDSFGLQIMQERAESIGATLTVHSTIGIGSQVVICVPVQ